MPICGAFTEREEPLAPFVSHFVDWNLIPNYNKPRKPSSTQDNLNNKAEVQMLFDFMVAALPGTQQPLAERFIAHRNPLPRGTAGQHESFRESFTISLVFDQQQKRQS